MNIQTLAQSFRSFFPNGQVGYGYLVSEKTSGIQGNLKRLWANVPG